MKLLANNKLRVGVLSLAMLAGSLCTVDAQTKGADGQIAYPQKATPIGIDNFHFSTYYYSGSNVYTLLGQEIGTASGDIIQMKVNPSGISYALLSSYDDGSTTVTAYDLWQTNETLHEFYDVESPSAICYTPDGRRLLIAQPNKLVIYDATYYKYIDQMAMPFAAKVMAVSNDERNLAAAKSRKLTVWDFEQKLVFKEMEMSATVNDITFSDDNSKMAVLTADGKLHVYATSDFHLLQSYDKLNNAGQCSFHPDGKFLAVVVNSERIVLLSLDDPQYRSYIDNEEGGTSDVQFVRDGKKQTYLVYNTSSTIVYKPMDSETSVTQGLSKSKVVDGDGNPIPGALVEEINGSESTITELDGTYYLPASKSRLRVTYPGMSTRTISASSTSNVSLSNLGWINEGPEKYNWIVTLQGAFPESGLKNPSFGVMVGKVKDFGWYVKGVYRPVKSTSSDYDNSVSGQPTRFTTGNSKHSYWAATAGAIVRVKGPFYGYVGAGYVDRKIAVELHDGSYAKDVNQSYSGATLDYGVMFNMYHVVITAGAMTNLSDGCHFTGCVGIGVSF